MNIRGLRSNIGELSNLCHRIRTSIVVVVETFLDNSEQTALPSLATHSAAAENEPTHLVGEIAVYCLEGLAITTQTLTLQSMNLCGSQLPWEHRSSSVLRFTDLQTLTAISSIILTLLPSPNSQRSVPSPCSSLVTLMCIMPTGLAAAPLTQQADVHKKLPTL